MLTFRSTQNFSIGGSIMDTYTEIMRDSKMRQDAICELIGRSEKLCSRIFSDKIKESLRQILSVYEVENGVTVFHASKNPKSKKCIAKFDCGKDVISFWWGDNLKASSGYANQYAMGISIERKIKKLEMYTVKEMIMMFPDFAEFFVTLKKGTILDIYVYSGLNAFMKEAKNLNGNWIISTPDDVYSYINQSIGKWNGNRLYIFQANKPTLNYNIRVKIV